MVEGEVIPGHAFGGEALLEPAADRGAVELPIRARAATASASLETMKPVTPSSTISGTEPRFQATTGVPQAIASIITRPKGSGQSIGNRSARAPPRSSPFRVSSTGPR